MKMTVKNYSPKPCPDAYFGILKYDNGHFSWEALNCCYHKAFRQKLGQCHGKGQLYSSLKNLVSIHSVEGDPMMEDLPVLCLVLESPHINEFDANQNPRGPAMGLTGVNIGSFLPSALDQTLTSKKPKTLHDFLNKHTQDGKGRMLVFLMNLVQYQCSLGISPINRLIVEENWSKYWFARKDGGKKNFEKRIHGFKKPEIFLVNACTIGDYFPLKNVARYFLKGLIGKKKKNKIAGYCEAAHPRSWKKAPSFKN